MENIRTLKDFTEGEKSDFMEYFNDLKEALETEGKKLVYLIDFDNNSVYLDGKIFVDLDELDDYLISKYN